jgi:hypothetical protein
MAPYFASNDCADYLLTNAASVSKCLLTDTTSSIKFADLQNDRGVEFCVIHSLASRRATLPRLVGMILGTRTQPEMIGATASRHVAGMTNIKTVWNRTNGQFPRDARCDVWASVELEVAPTVIFMPCASPQPAVMTWSHEFPEPLTNCRLDNGQGYVRDY